MSILSIGGLAACGDDSESADAAYCDAWAGVRTAFERYAEVDVIEAGLSSIREYVEGIESALADVREINQDRVGEEADALRTAFDELSTVLTSGELPVDRVEEVRAAADEVDGAWADLVAAVDVDCPPEG